MPTVPGSGTAATATIGSKSVANDFVIDFALVKSAAWQVPVGQKNNCSCPGVIPATLNVNFPSQFVSPAPSVTVPNAGNPSTVPVGVSVRRIGEPAKMEQESPTLTAAAQLVLDDPGPTPVMVYRMYG